MGNHELLSDRLKRELFSFKEQGQLRTLCQLQGVDLCSNDYLGLSTDSRLRQAITDGLARTPSVASKGSRLLSGNAAEWEQTEADFATFAGREAALYFS